ncbi:hypothetical protein YC2023_072161 [Brassica napus]
MGGGAWPFLVGGAICLIIAIVGLQRGIPSKRESSARVDYVPALCTHRPSLLPLNDPVKCLDRGDVDGSPSATLQEAGLLLCLPIPWLCVHPCPRLQFWLDRTPSFRISPNPGTKSVKENATKQPAFANPEMVFVRKRCCNVKSKTTLGNGYLASRIDEECSKMRYLV